MLENLTELLLPALLLLCDKVICKTTLGMAHIGKRN